MPFLEIANVRKQFAPTAAVENFDLQMEHGELVWFPGPLGVLLTRRGQTQPEGAR